MRLFTYPLVTALFLTAAVLCTLLASCGSENTPSPSVPLPGPTTPLCPNTTPATPSYTTDVAPIIAARCSGCHQNGRADGGIALNSLAQVKTAIQSNGLLNQVNTNNMPKGSSGIPQCEKEILTNWSNTGFSN